MLYVIPQPNRVHLLGGARALQWADVAQKTDAALPAEGYRLTVTETSAVAESATDAGMFYAQQTFLQLQNADGTVPLVRIDDAPRFAWRSFMIDSARHMQTVDEIKAYIAAAARCKCNVFHWHLCDDQGWRVESERYPALNTIGAFRDGWGFGSDNAERYGGYYTKAQIRDVVAFCAARHITVVPEFDMPGHTTAVLAAFPELSCRKRALPVQTQAGIFKDILCAGREETFTFCFNILEELLPLFPGPYVHIGGDEAPKDRWNACPDCQARMKAEHLPDAEALQGYFTRRIVDFLRARGKTALVWNESLNSGMVPDDVIAVSWMDKNHRCDAFANAGGKILMEDFFHVYLDYPYGMTPLRKTYSYDLQPKTLTAAGKANVLGVEAPIWTEFVEDFARLCYQCFPRLLAVAELGWTQPPALNLRSFKKRAAAQRAALAALGVAMAPEKAWDPRGPACLGGIIEHYRTFINRETIRAWLRGEDDA